MSQQDYRQEFRVLPALPWDTNAVVSNLVPTGYENTLGALKSTLMRRELLLCSKVMYDPNDTKVPLHAIHRFLTTVEETSNTAAAPAHFSPFAQQLCIYRIFDIANRLVPNQTASPVAKHEKQSFTIKKSFYKHMDDWLYLVQSFIESQERSSHPDLALALTGNNSTREEDFSWKMLNAISNLNDMEELSTVKGNILVAAFCMRYFLNGHLDLPENIAIIYDSLSKAVSLSVPRHWPRGKDQTQQMRLPLQLALTISPLCLLIPVRLSRLDVKREDLVVAWQCLGNKRPSVVKQAEDLLWKVIFKIATDQAELQNVLPFAMHQIAALAKNATEEEKTWFRRDEQLVQNPSFLKRSVKLLSCPENWPNHEALQNLAVRGINPPPEFGKENLKENRRGEDEAGEDDMGEDEAGEDDMGLDDVGLDDVGEDDVGEDEVGKDEAGEDDVDEDEAGEDEAGEDEADDDEAGDEADSDEAVNSGQKEQQGTSRTPRNKAPTASYNLRRVSKRVIEPPANLETKVVALKRKITPIPKTEHVLEHVHFIDLTVEWDLPRHTLDLKGMDAEPSSLATEFTMYGTLGTTKTYKSPLPFDDDQRFLNGVVEMLQRNYIQGQPRHLTRNGNSVFYVLDHETFQSLSAKRIQELYQRHHIVVTGVPRKKEILFNRQGLETLGSWNGLRTMHDMTIPVRNGDFSVRQFQGSLKDLWKHASSEDGRILNALDFPLPDAEGPDCRLASDVKAWKDTFQTPLWKKEVEYPVHNLRWGLAATCGAQHLWHIDAEGVGTTMDVQTGSKWWFVAEPKQGQKSIINLKHETDWAYDPGATNDNLWDCEAILLIPGTKLIMKPNTPHMVVTPENAICHGNHFICTSTLQQTSIGLIHSFVQRHMITNTENRAVWYNLQRLLLYYRELYLTAYFDDPDLDKTHLPDCGGAEGLLDLFTFLAVMELGLALFPGSYDVDGISVQDWLRFNQAKAAALDIVNWFRNHFDTRGSMGQSVDIYSRLLLQISTMLIVYKEKAIKNQYGHRKVTARLSTSAVLYEVLEVLARHSELDEIVGERLGMLSEDFLYNTEVFGQFTVHRMNETEILEHGWNADHLHLKPDLDVNRYYKIKKEIAAGEWPRPRITVTQFLCKEELKAFPFDDAPHEDSSPSSDDDQPLRKRICRK